MLKKSKYDDKYKGIKHLEHLFEEINEDEEVYYQSILANSSFKGSYEEYKSRSDKEKTLSIEQYLHKIMPHLKELINNHKAINDGSNECKIQLNMCIKFVSLLDAKDIRTVYVQSENNEIKLGNETDDIVNNFIDSFLNAYQKEQEVLRGRSDLVYENVESLRYQIHKRSLKKVALILSPLSG